MSAAPQKMLFRQGEVCRLLGVSPKVLRDEIRRLNLRYVQVGKRQLFTQADIDEFIAKKRGEWQERAAAGSQSAGRGRRSGIATSRSAVVDFETALARTTPTTRKS